MDKIRILELVKSGEMGGIQSHIISILRNIEKNKFDITIASGRGKFGEQVSELGFRYFPVELPVVLRHKYLKELQRLHKNNSFHIIHSHGGVGGFYGRLLKRHNPEIKSVHTFHGINYLNHENPLLRNASKAIDQYLVQFTDLILCTSEVVCRTAVKNKIADESRSRVIKNGINISKFANAKKNKKLRESLGLTDEHFVVGNVSWFHPQKNQSLIIQASYYLLKKYPEMRFVLVGDGPILKKMKEYARESELENFIIFTGEKCNVEDYYPMFDIFVFPSVREGHPLALLEAMASRLPIICSDIACNREIIRNNETALTVNPHEADDLVSKISGLYKNSQLRAKLAKNAFIEVTQYDEAEMIDKIQDAYRKVMQNSV